MATFSDPTLGHLRQLAVPTAAMAVHMVIAVRNSGVPLFISSSLRTRATQAGFFRQGLSATLRSKHLTGQAFDIDVLGFGRDQIPKWWLYNLGAFGEQHGLRWGGRWKFPRDFGHFEDVRSIR